MKKLILKWGIITCLLLSPQLNAQISVSININAQPAWGPSGYNYVEYYYLPDIDMYYNVPQQKYVYLHKGKWIWVKTLPAHCNHYNVYSGYKVVINESNPFAHYDQHKVKYACYKNKHGQQGNMKNQKEYKGNSHKKHHNGGKGKHGKGHH